MKISNFLYATLCAGVLLSGCKGKDGDPGPTGPAGPTGQNLTGSITGYANPVDEVGVSQPKAGVQVSIDNTAPALTAITDADGRYTFASVPSGSYNLTFSRAGFATTRRIGVAHIGGSQPTYAGVTAVSQPSTLAITGLTAVPMGSSPALVQVTLSFVSPAPTGSFRYALFASTTPNVTAANGVSLAIVSASPASPATTYQSTGNFTRFTFTNAGFAPGSTVYLVAYGSTATLSSYADPATGRVVYPALNGVASPVATVVVP